MSFFRPRKVEKNYDLLSACAWYTPGVAGLFAVLGWFLVGMVISGLVTFPLMSFSSMPMCYAMLIMYPLQFIAVFIFVRFQSGKNANFDRGYKLDSNHFGKTGGIVLAVLAAFATLAAAVMLEAVNSVLPDTSESLKKTMEYIMNGPLWCSLLCTAVMAPICEEWLCRGVILRGLLNYEHKATDLSDRPGRGMSPALAIVISAIFFAAIHGNLWQGVTAFAIGCLFGYVYYRTGSLKLTMLMHCVNNSCSVLLGHFGGPKVQDMKSLLDVMPFWEYAILFIVSAAIVWLLIRELRKVELQDVQGNCDIIPGMDDMMAAKTSE